MKVNAWTCALATDRDLESGLSKSISVWTQKMVNYVSGWLELYQVKQMIRGIGNVFVLDLFSNLVWVRSSGYFSEPLGQVMTLRGPFLVLAIRDEPNIG